MPVCALHLLSLHVPLAGFLSALSSAQLEPLVVSRVVRWIITPKALSVDPLLNSDIRWDLLLIIPSADPLPVELQSLVCKQWSIKIGVPSRLVNGFTERNRTLLKPDRNGIPPLTGALDKPRIAISSQDLELTDELRNWVKEFGSVSAPGSGAVSMLNLLAFAPGKKQEYLKYGAEFAKSIGARRGGNAKVVGTVVEDGNEKGAGLRQGDNVWDEVALAHYPSIWHFADMIASEDYQEANRRYRVGSLKDTLILCTSELDLPQKGTGHWARL
ncbi:uncharacterized protein K452DRAFT_289585 [Aplosporella prunicola CBS 121167]|uniref:DUF1330 domain-containing protein n=1 Tax=Aplosporella prunicola CBS 121167 TaxID=1176127 RepID=A0A6A6B6S9_9PEZI|nr:uncharacterized protein K452DRAFT_289585 [Aplosporella prunicola CBS 121167]KAF2139586.1 hypothetical protein K452DRAFT_289585 [Aplosporella prunicola CBS 121167]